MKKILSLILFFALTGNAFGDPVTSQYMPDAVMRSTTPGFAAKDLRALANIAASQTDSSVITAVAGKKIRVTGVTMVAGGTATNVTFNSKPAGSGVAISPLFALGINGVLATGWNPQGWFETVSGEGLTVTTGAGATTGILVTYITY